MKVGRQLVVGGFVVAGFTLFLLGCGRTESEAVAEAVPVETKETDIHAINESLEVDALKLVGKPFTSRIEATGTALPARESLMSAEVPGKIQKIFVTEGQPVKKGQVLLKFDQTGFNLGVQQAKAGLAGAKTQVAQLELELQRISTLIGAEAAPQATYDQLKAKYDGAKAQQQMTEVGLKQARKALGDSVLRAPYDGVVSEILHEEGEYAPSMPQTMLIKIVDTSSLEVQAFLPEETAADVTVGMQSTIEIESAGVEIQGNVVFVSNRLKAGSQTYEIRIKLDNTDGRIKGGAFARVGIVRRSVDDAILVPLRAVRRDEDGKPFVFVAERSKARPVSIELGGAEGDQVRVTDGLSQGQLLITSQISELEDGDPIVVSTDKV